MKSTYLLFRVILFDAAANPLTIIRRGAVVQLPVAFEFAIRDRLCGTADVSPIHIWAQIFDLHGAVGCLLDLNGHRLSTPTLFVSELPEIGDGRTDLISDGLTLILGQGFEVGVESVHGSNDSICSRKAQALARKTITFAITANASFKV